MQNSACAKYKFSRLEGFMNNALLIVFGLQVVLAIIASSFNSKWIINNSTDHSSD